jgi:hypothetical protein
MRMTPTETTHETTSEAPTRSVGVQRLVMPGDVWRKRGPCDWVKVLRVQMPHNPDYDGGLPGCSVVFTNCKGNWQRKSWFIAAKDSASFEKKMTDDFRFMA